MDNKKIAIISSSICAAIIVVSMTVIMYNRYKNPAVPVLPDNSDIWTRSEPEETSESGGLSPEWEEYLSKEQEKSSQQLKANLPDVIEEKSESKPEDKLPPPEISETTGADGTVVQTPNWEAQKELAPDTDLSNPESKPEYKQPETSTPAPSGGNSGTGSTPKNGDTKTVGGESYMYVSGFGWVKEGSGNVQTIVDAPTTGNKVGY